MEQLGGERIGDRTSLQKVIAASLIGSVIEWYDFFIYGTAAALIFGQLFFPGSDPLIGTLYSFGTYAVGFIARPIGGVFFGHYGDKIGRKSMLVMTLIVMGVATTLVGLLPTYESIGIWAPILLVVLRFLQGFAVGGEWGGATLMAVEYAPPGRRGFFGSWPGMGIPAGLVVATAVFTASSSLPPEQFLSWGWRVPFLVSIVLVAVGLFVRLKILETPAFQQMQESGGSSELPVLDVFRYYWRSLLLTMGAFFLLNGGFYVTVTFMLAYGTQNIGVDSGTMLTGVLIAGTVQIFAIGAFAALSDRVGRRPVYLGGAVFLLLFSFPLFWMINTGVAPLIWLAMSIAIVALGAMYGPSGAFFSELFSTRVRYSGASLGYQLASAVAGGFAPVIAVALLSAYGYPAVALYMIVMALITITAVYLATETYQRDISGYGADEEPVTGGQTVRG
ncbi:MAG: MHS family MFS transporter [Actinomycetota bacterium]|nr:MHS family MFS transporter [Actinomycetota bacterium]